MIYMVSDYLKIPEKFIPYGLYCYHDNYICPFWESRIGEYPNQEDGYCYFLCKSDWNLNEEYKYATKVVYSKGNVITDKNLSELFDSNEIDVISGKRIHFIYSLLWDKCKECGINEADPDDIELVLLILEAKNENHIPILKSKNK